MPGSWVVVYGGEAASLAWALGEGWALRPMVATGDGPGPWPAWLQRLWPPQRSLGVVLDVWGRPPPPPPPTVAAASWLWARASGPAAALAMLPALVAAPGVQRVVVRDMDEMACLAPPASKRGHVPALLQRCRRLGVDVVGCFGAIGAATCHRGAVDANFCAHFAAWASVRAQTCASARQALNNERRCLP